MTSEPNKLLIVYDGECPFCSNYVKLIRIRESFDDVQLIDARKNPLITQDLHSRGLNLDDGMVLIMNDQYFHGADCINRLAMMSTELGWFNKLNAALFRSQNFSRLSYPFLRAGRNAVLFLLRRKPIHSAN